MFLLHILVYVAVAGKSAGAFDVSREGSDKIGIPGLPAYLSTMLWAIVFNGTVTVFPFPFIVFEGM